jgi:hypothetical protein
MTVFQLAEELQGLRAKKGIEETPDPLEPLALRASKANLGFLDLKDQ